MNVQTDGPLLSVPGPHTAVFDREHTTVFDGER